MVTTQDLLASIERGYEQRKRERRGRANIKEVGMGERSEYWDAVYSDGRCCRPQLQRE